MLRQKQSFYYRYKVDIYIAHNSYKVDIVWGDKL